MEPLNIGPVHPGPRPRRPARPRPPQEVIKRTEVVWSSDDDDILLVDVLHMIPSTVRAEMIRISLEKDQHGPRAVISYECDIPNTRFLEQSREYGLRLIRYEQELQEWAEQDAEWAIRRSGYEDAVLRVEEAVAEAFAESMPDVVT